MFLLVQKPHHQRNFHAHNRADQQHQRIEQGTERRGGKPKGDKQEQRRQSARQSDQKLDFHKTHQHIFVFDIASKVRANAHGKKIQADDERILENAVTQKIAGQSRHNQLVCQAATGHHKYG